MANDDFSEPPRRADSKNPTFFFPPLLGLGHLQGLEVRFGRILGVLSIQPFLGEGGVRPEGSIDTPPPPRETKTRPPLERVHRESVGVRFHEVRSSFKRANPPVSKSMDCT